jgi:hypothetical protein
MVERLLSGNPEVSRTWMRRLIVFNPKAMSKVSGADKLAAQAREASAAAAARARDMTSASKSVRNGVFSARCWAAPRLESVADYTSGTVAPKVSSVLRDTARQISPPNRRKEGFCPALRWPLLATVAAAMAGAAALLARRRYRAAMVADTEEDAPVAAGQPTSATGTESARSTGSASADGPADTGVNGRVSASG